jgi:hypothetical protein
VTWVIERTKEGAKEVLWERKYREREKQEQSEAGCTVLSVR